MAEDMELAQRRIRDAYEAFNRGDFDAAVEHLHSDVVFHRVADFETAIKGRDAVRANLEPDVFATQRGEILETEAAGDCVIARVVFHATGAGSGIEMADEAWHLWRMRDGLAVEFRYFDTREEALAAA